MASENVLNLNWGIHPGRWWHKKIEGKISCDLCPRNCQLREGQRGFCYIRRMLNGEIWLTSYGRASGFCIDPVEKKPLNHFFPGSSVLSFGTAGCNLGCQFCQNWDISKAHADDRLTSWAAPIDIVNAALQQGCKSIAYTYNDPVIFAEYAIDCAKMAREFGIKNICVSAGYINPQARKELFSFMDAANIDLKAFSEDFYQHVCYASLAPILDTLLYLKHETNVWLEITTLLIPGLNDSEKEIALLSEWIFEHLGPQIPLHFTAFHPDFRMRDISPTPQKTLTRARKQAMSIGLNHVYTGNVWDSEGSTTYCTYCHAPLIRRHWYAVESWNLGGGGTCQRCKKPLAGFFEDTPGAWGNKRLPIKIEGKN